MTDIIEQLRASNGAMIVAMKVATDEIERLREELRTSGEYSYADLMGIHDDALEKAAKVVEDFDFELIDTGNELLAIAAAIRALKDKHDDERK